MGNELGPVVAADECRCGIDADQLLQHGHYVLGLAASAHPDGQAEPAVLVDHVQQLEQPPLYGGVQLEIHRPNLAGVSNRVARHRSISGPGPLLLYGSGPLQALLPAEAVHSLVVRCPGLAPQQAISHATATADVLSGDLAKATPEIGLLDVDNISTMALGVRCRSTIRQAHITQSDNRHRTAIDRNTEQLTLRYPVKGWLMGFCKQMWP